MAGGERIFEVLDTEPRIKDKPDAIELETVEGRVDFEDVYFHYNETVPILRGITLHVQPGETIAFVGPTGAGKTTITSLISRGYEVTSGAIKIDGHDIRDVKRRSLTQHMGVVLQNPYLFSGTVRENIARARLRLRWATRVGHHPLPSGRGSERSRGTVRRAAGTHAREPLT